MDNVPMTIEEIIKINDGKYEVIFCLKDKQRIFDRKEIELLVPLSDGDDPYSAVTVESADDKTEVLELDKTHYRLILKCTLEDKLRFYFVFSHCKCLEGVWKYIGDLLLANLKICKKIIKLCNYTVNLNEKHIPLCELHPRLFIGFYDDNGYYGLITRHNIETGTLVVSKTANYIEIFPQHIYCEHGRDIYLNHKSVIDVCPEVCNAVLDLRKSVNICVSFTSINYEECDSVQLALLKSLVNDYGVFDVYNADTGLVYAKGLRINSKSLVIQVDKIPVRLKVKAYMKGLEGERLCFIRITSSTVTNPEYVASHTATLGCLTVYKKFKKAIVDLLIHDLHTKTVIPGGNVVLKLVDCNEYVKKVSYGSHLNVGVYKIDKIYLKNNFDNIHLKTLETHFECDKKIFKEYSTLSRHDCTRDKCKKYGCNRYDDGWYTTDNKICIVAGAPRIHINIWAKIKNLGYRKPIYNLHLWGWIFDYDASRYIKLHPDGSLDLDLCYKKCTDDLTLYEAARKKYINDIILENASCYKNGMISLGNHKYQNIFEMDKCRASINTYTNFTKERQDLNNFGCVLGINIGKQVSIQELPGWLTCDEIEILACAPIDEIKCFCEKFCKITNPRFVQMATDIISLLFMCNYVNIEIDEALIDYPGYIVLFARAVKVINDLLLTNGICNLCGYSISIPVMCGCFGKTLPHFDNGGVEKRFKEKFLKLNLRELMCDEEFVETPLYVSTYFKSFEELPMEENYEKYLIEYANQSQDLLQGLLNTYTVEDTNARVISSVYAFTYRDKYFNDKYNTKEYEAGVPREGVFYRDGDYKERNYYDYNRRHKYLNPEALSKLVKVITESGNMGMINKLQEDYTCMPSCDEGYSTINVSKSYCDWSCEPNNNYELICKYGYKLIDLERIHQLLKVACSIPDLECIYENEECNKCCDVVKGYEPIYQTHV
uniref:Spherulin n=1 Tax=unidentified entomopoxvirus TaxID=10291 RepID=Q66770_9POXV|nr:spherulin [unidentified entomopoxvirus]